MKHFVRRLFLDSGTSVRAIAALLLLSVTGLIAGCGGGSGGSGGPPPAPQLASIAVTPANPSVAKGSTQQLTATGTYSDGSTKNLSSTVTWSSGSPSVASISAAGLATGVAAGTAVITATDGSLSGKTNLTVPAPALVSIAVTPASASIVKGNTQQYIATGTYADNSTQVITAQVTWKSSAPAVSTISAVGLASGVGAGSASITAVSGGITSPAVSLTVTAATLVSVAVTPANPVLPVSSSQQLVVIGTYSDGSTVDLTSSATWTSSTPAVATVSNAGVVTTALGKGTTTITATLGANTSAVTLIVTAQEYAYAANFLDGTISQYSIGPDGILAPLTPASVTAVTPAAANDQPFSIVVDPTNRYIYVTNYQTGGGNTVSQFTIGASGGLTAMTPATAVTGAGPNSVVVDPSGKYAYVANLNGNSISQYTVGVSGALTPMTPATVPDLDGPASIVVDSATSHAYVANFGLPPTGPYSATVSIFDIGVGGALTAAASPIVAAGTAPASITLDPTGKYAYVANTTPAGGSGNISMYGVASGVLSPMTPATVTAGSRPVYVVTDPSGKYAYVANQGDSISQFTIGAGGMLSPLSTLTAATGSRPDSITLDGSGHFAYVTNRGTPTVPQNTIAQYTIGTNGILAPMTPATVAAGSAPANLAVTHY